ncbi:hypothetical protein EBS02_01110 [bacterium]|nr:hypothetical protein [bacterium]
MAFDFLGTFTQRMWNSFNKFTKNVLYKNLWGITSSALIYDPDKHTYKQRHLPRAVDHQIAEAARMNLYFDRYSSAKHKSFAKLNPKSSIVQYPFTCYETSFPISDTNSQLKTVLKDFYPTTRNDDYQSADIVMYIKTKISNFIKSRFERDEYRLKRCLDYIDTVLTDQDLLDTFVNGNKAFLSYSSLVAQVESGFTNKDLGGLIDSQVSIDPSNLDGESLSNTERSIAQGKGNSQIFIIPGDPQRVIYRGQLFLKKEQIGTSETSKMLQRLSEIQNPFGLEQ